MGKKEQVISEMIDSLEQAVKKMSSDCDEDDGGCSVGGDEIKTLNKIESKLEEFLAIVKKEKKKEKPEMPVLHIAGVIGNHVVLSRTIGSHTGNALLCMLLEKETEELRELFFESVKQ
jgi:hypothetical protein